jgi:hypothetical protein
VSRRDLIKMTDEEVAAFLDEQRVMTCATNGQDGWPHLMPLWYVLHPEPGGGTVPQLRGWTYAVSQKVRNLERDPRATVQIETGDEYSELRGVMFKAEVELIRELEPTARIGAELGHRYGGADLTPELEQAMQAQAAKRVGLVFHVRETATWDHRKLGGVY